MELSGKKIVLSVTGGIAAYKSVLLLRLLLKEGADVQVLMTPAAKEFVSPVTFSALSGKKTLSDFFNPSEGDWNSHVKMGVEADLMIIAPATANTMAKMANGLADNLVVATYLSARCPVLVAPAMDMDMFAHPSTQRNLDILESYGNLIIEPAEGELASGLAGKGRMREPEEILQYIKGLQPDEKKKSSIKKS
jgi:phosphopantothenoylcysteine decarboxylase/phosphopantothenate--cysteine ligase